MSYISFKNPHISDKKNVIAKVLFFSLFIMVLIISLWLKVYISSMKDYHRAVVCYSNNQNIRAVNYLDRSMHWYAPLNPYVDRSADMLLNISKQAEKNGDIKLSFIALNSIKNSLYSTRSIFPIRKDILKKCEKRIKENLDIMAANGSYYQTHNKSSTTITHAATRYDDPNTLWSFILLFSLSGWIGSVLGFIYFKLNDSMTAAGIMTTSWFWFLMGGISYSLWIISMVRV